MTERERCQAWIDRYESLFGPMKALFPLDPHYYAWLGWEARGEFSEPIHQVRPVHSMVWRDVSEETFELLRAKPEYKVRTVFAKEEA